MTFGKPDMYGLPDIPVGGTKEFAAPSREMHSNIKRSAHNYNARTNMYFYTRLRKGILYVTRIR